MNRNERIESGVGWRDAIVDTLRAGTATTGELAAILGTTPQQLWRHLQRLQSERRIRRSVTYPAIWSLR